MRGGTELCDECEEATGVAKRLVPAVVLKQFINFSGLGVIAKGRREENGVTCCQPRISCQSIKSYLSPIMSSPMCARPVASSLGGVKVVSRRGIPQTAYYYDNKINGNAVACRSNIPLDVRIRAVRRIIRPSVMISADDDGCGIISASSSSAAAGSWRKGFGGSLRTLSSLTRRSTSGYVFTFAGAPISWFSKLQQTTTLSSTEAEYVELLLNVFVRLFSFATSYGLNLAFPSLHLLLFAVRDNNGAIHDSLYS